MMEQETGIGEVILKLREWRGISQEKLAVESGVDCQELTDIETGKGGSGLDSLVRIADYFNLKVGELVDLAHSKWKLSETTNELAEWMGDNGFEETVILESPNYLIAITGITADGRLIYS